MVVRLVGAARLVDGGYDVRVEPAFVDAQHPLATVDGAFNAVMLQGDAIREMTLAGPGAGGTETASAVVADITSVIGTMARASSERPAAWRDLPRLPPGEARSPFYFRLFVEDRPGALARVAEILARHAISIARLVQHQDGSGATLHVVTHEAAAGALARRARRARGACARYGGGSRPIPVVSDRGVPELGLGVTGARATWLTLGEGGTPLVRAPRLSESLGLDLHLKCEHLNPTGQLQGPRHGRRGRARAGRGVRTVVCASTGNTAASAATYAARAGLRAVVLTPEGATASAKRAQAHAVGRAGDRGPRHLRRRAAAVPRARRARRLHARQLAQPGPDRRPALGRRRDRRPARRRPDVIALPYGGGGNVSAVAARLRAKRASLPRSSSAKRPNGRRRSRRRSGSPSLPTSRGSSGLSQTAV